MGTLIDTFIEGLRVVTWACTLTLLVPGLALMLVARRCRATVAGYYVVGAAFLGWAQAAGHWWVAARGMAVVIAGFVAAATYAAAWKASGHSSPFATGAGLVGGALAGWMWRPCVGERLGDILNDAAGNGARSLGLLFVYLTGALLPVILLAVAAYALPVIGRALDWTPLAIIGAVIGVAYAITLATGQYDDLIGELYRISSGY